MLLNSSLVQPHKIHAFWSSQVPELAGGDSLVLHILQWELMSWVSFLTESGSSKEKYRSDIIIIYMYITLINKSHGFNRVGIPNSCVSRIWGGGSLSTEATCFVSWFPHRLENLERWENFFQSGNFEQTRKVREFYPKYWKNEETLAHFYFFRDFWIEMQLLNSLNKTPKLENEKKILENSRNFFSLKMWEPCFYIS